MYFAELDKNNTVLRVIVAPSLQWCIDTFGGTWVETKKNDPNKNFAGVGHIYYADKGNFSHPKPYDSWVLTPDCKWQAPTPMPKGEVLWDEASANWVSLTDITTDITL